MRKCINDRKVLVRIIVRIICIVTNPLEAVIGVLTLGQFDALYAVIMDHYYNGSTNVMSHDMC